MLRSSCPDRLACGVIEYCHQEGDQSVFTKIVFASVYGQAAEDAARDHFLGEVVQGLSQLSARWMALGDFNLEASDPGLTPFIATGLAHCLDDAFVELPVATRRDGSRRIDFGLAHPSMFAVQRDQSVGVDYGISDHDLVAYDFGVVPLHAGSFRPKRAPILDEVDADGRDAPCSQRPVPDCDEAFESTFLQVLDRDVNEAWAFLSDFAENQLAGGVPRGSCLRSSLWKPQVTTRRSKASSASEPVYLVRLRRFHRRLLHLALHPLEDQLRVRVHRDINYFHAALLPASAQFGGGSPHLWPIRPLADFVGSTVEDEVNQLKEQRIRSWQARLALSPDKQRRWVKSHAGAHVREMRAARPSPTLGGVQACAVHPARALRDLEEEWCDFWRQAPGCGTARDFQVLLREVPTEVHLIDGIELSVDDLRRSMKAMTSKASGPDDWSAAQLLRMGPRWWRCLTSLWNNAPTTSRIPDRWLESRVVLIPKPTSGHRPLAVASVLWRAGTRAVLRHLRPWIDSWASTHLFGGLPARGAEDALHWIYHGLSASQANGVAVRQDIHRYFDSIDFRQAVAVLRHIRAPPALTGLLETFYSRERRIFAIGPHHGSTWQTGFARGVLQGCPLSPLLGAAVMLPWLHQVSLPGVHVAVYMDDRVMWAQDPCFAPQFSQALHRTDCFDKVFSFRCRPSKCGTSAATQATVMAFGIDHLGYPFDPKFPVLGVVFEFQDIHNVTLLNFDLDLVLARVTDIARVVKAWKPRYVLLNALVTPSFTWAAGVAQPSHDVLHKIRNAILGSFGISLPPDVPWGPFFEILGWKAEPLLATFAAALRAAVRTQASLKPWVDQAPLHFAASHWTTKLPGAVHALRHLGWGISQDATCIQRRDTSDRLRVFRLGSDCFSSIFNWLVEWRRADALFSSARVRRSLRRPADLDFPLAQGLQLPAPERGFPTFGGHKLCALRAGSNRELFLASLAVGCNWWHFHRGSRAHRGAHLRQCACGGFTPSRPHLVWQCPETAVARAGVQLPADRAEERMFSRLIPERPPPPSGFDPGIKPVLVNNMRQRLRDDPVLFIATDGSEIEGVAAFSILVPGYAPLASGLDTEAQTAFRAEVEAALLAIEAALEAVQLLPGGRVRLVFVIDCQSAIVVLQGGGLLPNLAARASASLRRLRALAQVEFFWIPAHGRSKFGWTPHALASEVWLRHINDVVDKAARAMALALLHGSDIQAWTECRTQAVNWEVAAITAAAEAAKLARSWWWTA